MNTANPNDQKAYSRILQAVARGWCAPENANKVMDCDLAEAIAREVAAVSSMEGWIPTPENINALPLPLRKYIHNLETDADPAGTIRENVLVREENAALRALIAERDSAAEPELPVVQGSVTGQSTLSVIWNGVDNPDVHMIGWRFAGDGPSTPHTALRALCRWLVEYADAEEAALAAQGIDPITIVAGLGAPARADNGDPETIVPAPSPGKVWTCKCGKVNPKFDPWCSACEEPQP